MLRTKTFGKLGKRAVPRLDIAIEGGLATTGYSEKCRVENVSRTGCRLHLDREPRLGTTVMIRIERIETLGDVTWVRNGRCGVTFADPLKPRELERLLWIVKHTEKHENNVVNSATAMWR